MSWNVYLDSLKSANSQGLFPVAEAAIWGTSDKQEAMWATTPGLEGIMVEEIKKIAHDRSKFREVGVYVAGKKYMMLGDNLDTDNNNTMNLKSAKDADGSSYNMCVGKTNKALIIAMGTKEANGGQLNDKVFKLVEYLRKSDF